MRAFSLLGREREPVCHQSKHMVNTRARYRKAQEGECDQDCLPAPPASAALAASCWQTSEKTRMSEPVMPIVWKFCMSSYIMLAKTTTKTKTNTRDGKGDNQRQSGGSGMDGGY